MKLDDGTESETIALEVIGWGGLRRLQRRGLVTETRAVRRGKEQVVELWGHQDGCDCLHSTDRGLHLEGQKIRVR